MKFLDAGIPGNLKEKPNMELANGMVVQMDQAYLVLENGKVRFAGDSSKVTVHVAPQHPLGTLLAVGKETILETKTEEIGEQFVPTGQ